MSAVVTMNRTREMFQRMINPTGKPFGGSCEGLSTTPSQGGAEPRTPNPTKKPGQTHAGFTGFRTRTRTRTIKGGGNPSFFAPSWRKRWALIVGRILYVSRVVLPVVLGGAGHSPARALARLSTGVRCPARRSAEAMPKPDNWAESCQMAVRRPIVVLAF